MARRSQGLRGERGADIFLRHDHPRQHLGRSRGRVERTERGGVPEQIPNSGLAIRQKEKKKAETGCKEAYFYSFFYNNSIYANDDIGSSQP